MFIHIGNRETVSDKDIIGIFSYKTLSYSLINSRYTENVDNSLGDIKTIVIDNKDKVLLSKVSSFTIIKRTTIDEKDCAWSRK